MYDMYIFHKYEMSYELKTEHRYKLKMVNSLWLRVVLDVELYNSNLNILGNSVGLFELLLIIYEFIRLYAYLNVF